MKYRVFEWNLWSSPMRSLPRVLALVAVYIAPQLHAVEEPNVNLDLPVTFNMVLNALPDAADAYVRLERDIGQLENLMRNAERTHSAAVSEYTRYKQRSDNAYNQNDSFRLFRQLDQKQVQQNIRTTVYDLNRLQRKLNQSMSQYEALKQQVLFAYIEKNQVPVAQLHQHLLDGEPVALLPSQYPEVLEYLRSLEKKPAHLARALDNASVMAILPDHIKEQLLLLKESGVSMSQALSRPDILQVVVANLDMGDARVSDEEDLSVLSVYRTETAFQEVDVQATPLQLSSYLDAYMVEMNDLVELYDLPVPSEAVIDAAQP